MAATRTPALRVRGHRLETIACRGGLIASCSCDASLRPQGRKGQTGRSAEMGLGLFVGYFAREAIREAHEAHKAEVLAARAEVAPTADETIAAEVGVTAEQVAAIRALIAAEQA